LRNDLTFSEFPEIIHELHVLVTGGAGYLGSVLCEQLLASGYRVTTVDDMLYQQRSLLHLCANPHFDFVSGDARDKELMRRLVRKPTH